MTNNTNTQINALLSWLDEAVVSNEPHVLSNGYDSSVIVGRVKAYQYVATSEKLAIIFDGTTEVIQSLDNKIDGIIFEAVGKTVKAPENATAGINEVGARYGILKVGTPVRFDGADGTKIYSRIREFLKPNGQFAALEDYQGGFNIDQMVKVTDAKLDAVNK